jgi:diadenosine tetraphosphatase ApaH/serine/threonine PP2A family protein phosphatase
MEMFDALPLAAVVDTTQGKYLAVHGGLSPFIKNVEEIKKLNRFSEPVLFPFAHALSRMYSGVTLTLTLLSVSHFASIGTMQPDQGAFWYLTSVPSSHPFGMYSHSVCVYFVAATCCGPIRWSTNTISMPESTRQ